MTKLQFKDIVYSVDNIVNAQSYQFCILEKDYTLSFYDEQGRQGGALITKEHYKNYGETYGEAVVNYIQIIKKDNKSYWEKIMAMLELYIKGYMPLYFNEIAKELPKPEIKIIKGDKYIKKFEKAQEKVKFAIQIIERLKYEIHDLTWKHHINEATKELKK